MKRLLINLSGLALLLLFVASTAITGFAASQADQAAFQTYLDNLFTDKSCTELKPGITAAGLEQNDSYRNLPETLKMMAMKIALGDWAESYDYSSTRFAGTPGDWDDLHARKYRVQLYEPYSNGETAASLAGITQYTNMNNPTGIVGDAGNTIYVMVGDDIPSGTTLYIGEVADYELHNGLTTGTRLNKGLNIITCVNDNSHFFIYYAAPTVTKSSGSTRYKPDTRYRLSDIPPLKIHIEGGRLNGFFNYAGDTRTDAAGRTLYTPDTQEDFAYTVSRATNPMYDLIGKYVILHFHLYDTDKGGTSPVKGVRSALLTNRTTGEGREYNPAVIMKSWDDMCLNERILMGLQSDEELAAYNADRAEKIFNDRSKIFYSTIVGTGDKVTLGDTSYSLDPGYHYNDYFNNRLMGLSQDRDGLFMSATSWRMNFHINTVDAILTLFNHGDIWGPAHEYGHINQGPMNMAGTTEESNNIFSNVAVYFLGNETSRSDFISSEFKIFSEGKNFLENGTWGTTRMFWQLWCYYHATGHNTKFYPRLYELLRNHPLQKVTRPGKHNLRYDQLHFAKMCCIAAGEDLTDFFTAWGFFVPMDLYPIEDYSAYDAYLTEADIKAVKEEIAALGFKKNEAIILIDDRPGATGRKSYNGFPIENAGKYGGLDDFRNEKAPEGEFSFKIDVNTVTVTATGSPGAGYIIRDSEGNLLGFANADVFEVSDELAAKLRSGEASITAVGTDNTTAEVANLLIGGSNDEKKAILNGIISKTMTLLSYVDEDAVGYLLPEAAAPLQQLADEARELAAADDATGEALTAMIDRLSAAFIGILNSEDSFVKVEAGNTYQITNNYKDSSRDYTTLVLTTDRTKLTAQKKESGDKLIFQWYFEPSDLEGTYYLRNADTGDFVGMWNAADRAYPMGTSEPYLYDLQSQRSGLSNIGVFGIAAHGSNQGFHYNNGVIYWTTSAGASQWTIRKIHDASDDAIADRQIQRYYGLLQLLMAKYEALKENIDSNATKVGYLKPEAENIFNSICDAIQSFIERDDATAEECDLYYQEQLALFDATVTSEEVCIGIEPGAAYVITNVNKPGRHLNTDDTNLTSTTNTNIFTAQWVFEKTESPDLYAIRSLSTGKYITSKGLSYTSDVPLKETPDNFGLIANPETLGEFGISAYLDPTNSLILTGDNTVFYVRLSMLSSDMGRWTIRKVRDREYVELRDRLGELMKRGQEIIWHPDYWGVGPAALDFFLMMEDVPAIYNSPSTPQEELKKWVDKLENNLAFIDASIRGSEIVTFEGSAYFNDKVDESEDEDVIRHAFVPKGEIRFKKLLKFQTQITADDVRVSVAPLSGGGWMNRPGKYENLKDDYLNAFHSWETDDNFLTWFNRADVNIVDGFYTAATARLEESGEPGVYDLIMYAPCSGLYEIKLYSDSDEFTILDAENRIPEFTVEIYPNLVENYGINGVIINGCTFNDNDSEGRKTIEIPIYQDRNDDLSACRIYLPGLYFAEEISASWVDETGEPLYLSGRNASGSGSSYFTDIDLSSLKRNPKGGLINVAVTKNGAKANFAFKVMADVSTAVDGIESDGKDDYIYFNLQGLRVANPGRGIYIRVRNGKSEKVIL